MSLYRLMSCIVFLLSLALSTSGWALLTAKVDRAAMFSSDTLRLTITSDKQMIQLDAKDREALDEGFDIIGQSTQSSMKFINGRSNNSFSTILTLSPKTTGTLEIPAFTFGKEQTSPISIVVKDATDMNLKDSSTVSVLQPFAEAVFDVQRAYVQGQIVVTFRITSPNLLVDYKMNPLRLNDVRIEKLKDGNFQKQDPTTLQVYYVYEVSYALFPQYSGKLTIPEQTIQTAFSLNNQFSQVWGGSRQQISRKILRTKAIEIDVLSKPASLPVEVKNRWLPAKLVRFSEAWNQSPNSAKLGDTLIRKITVSANGFPAEQLPELELDEHSALKVYQESAKNKNQQSGKSILGTRQLNYSYVPTEAGTYVLPETRLNWWNTNTQKLEIAIMPERKIVVNGVSTIVDNESLIDSIVGDDSDSSSLNSEVVGDADNESNSWFYQWLIRALCVLVLLLALWKFTVFVKQKMSRWLNEKQYKKQVLYELQDACEQENPQRVEKAVLKWAKVQFPDERCFSLLDIAKVADSEALAKEVGILSKCLYSKDNVPFSGSRLRRCIEQVSQQKIQAKPHKDVMQSLYPRPYDK